MPAVQLPRVRRKDFDSYLSSITPEYDRFVKNLHDSQEDNIPDPASTAHLPPLDSVPPVFFADNFDLTNAQTFKTVTSLLSSDDDVDPTSIAHSLPLLDALSAFADTTEAHLSHEISSRSSSFFAALSNLHTLQSSSSETLTRVRELRGKLKEVDKNNAKKGLQVVKKEVKLARLKNVQDGVEEVRGVVGKIGVMRGLVDAGQWREALNVLDDVDRLWDPTLFRLKAPSKRGVPAKAVPQMPLSSLTAFSLLPSHLKSMTQQMASSLSDHMASILRTDLEKQVYDPQYVSQLEDQLRPVLFSLLKTRGVKDAVLKWRQVVLADVLRGVIEQVRSSVSRRLLAKLRMFAAHPRDCL